MPLLEVDDAEIAYEVHGEGGPCLVLTPGGRHPARAGSALVDRLASRHRVVVFDRRNSGRSSVHFGPRLESDVEADDLLALVEAVAGEPVFVLGGGGGSRAALMAARRRPDLVGGLVLWWLIGGDFGLMTMGARYCQSLVTAARHGGMAAVAELPELAEVMEQETNRAHVLGLDPEEFVGSVKGWLEAWKPGPGVVVPGVGRDELSRIAVPTLVFDQFDDYHPSEVAHDLHAILPASTLVQPPPAMGPGSFWARVAKRVADPGVDPLGDWEHLAPQILDFVATAANDRARQGA